MSVNLRKKALLPAISMVTASVIALSGVSYAWFTMGNNAELGQLDVQVQAATGMQISLDAVNWKSVLDTSEIKGDISSTYAGAVNQFPAKDMAPVSTHGTVTSGRLKMFKGTVNDDGTLKSEAQTDDKGDTGNYIAFDVFFNMSQAGKIHLSAGSEVKGLESAKANTELASRVAFAYLGSTEGTPFEAQGLDGSGTAIIWEPNAKSHTDYAKANHGLTDQKDPYNGFSDIGEDYKPTEVTSTIAPDSFTVQDENTEVLDLQKGINKVRIYIWVEGQDKDCNNDISGGGISTILKFVQATATTTP